MFGCRLSSLVVSPLVHGGLNMLLLWILVLVVGIAYLAHRRTAPLPALGVVAFTV